ncbi:D-glycerate dehydrogenase [Phanerochaete sordida]|uniref:D-glycerate dehydrogenase n=1 Tax=Phanerochaete sordida TaxID=48140 RepID=A0A9P3G075_9APHY|nr:D-glycerate dehydrogenase [Phanerochaete sordida]
MSRADTAGSGERMKVVVTRNLGPDVMPLLQERKELDLVVWPEDRPCEREWFLQNVPGATGVIVMLSDKVNQELYEAAGPTLKIVSTMSVGYEHIDLQGAAQRNIRVGYTPDVLTDAVADISIMLALMAGRNVRETTELVARGDWPNTAWAPYGFVGPQLSANWVHPTRTAGFLGFGRISKATLARLVPFGFTDCVYTSNPSSTPNPAADAETARTYGLRSVRRVGLPELAAQSDVVFVLAPGGAATHHVVDAAFLRGMKSTAVLVNTARGTLVDSDALATALRERWIWGAGVDVVEGEPHVGREHPLVREPRCVVLPHIASATIETRLGMATTAAKNLLGALFGEAMPAEVQM